MGKVLSSSRSLILHVREEEKGGVVRETANTMHDRETKGSEMESARESARKRACTRARVHASESAHEREKDTQGEKEERKREVMCVHLCDVCDVCAFVRATDKQPVTIDRRFTGCPSPPPLFHPPPPSLRVTRRPSPS